MLERLVGQSSRKEFYHDPLNALSLLDALAIVDSTLADVEEITSVSYTFRENRIALLLGKKYGKYNIKGLENDVRDSPANTYMG